MSVIEGCRAAIVVSQISQGQDALRRGQNVLEMNRLDATQKDLHLARSAFLSAKRNFASAGTTMRHDPLLWALRHTPVIGHQATAATDLTRIGEEASAIGSAGVDAADVFTEIRSDAGATLPEKSAVILERTRPAFEMIEQRLSVVDALRSDIGGGPLLPPLARAAGEFDQRRQRVGEVVQAYDDAQEFVPEFLGFSRPKTYLVLAQNNAELLPTGGLVSVVGTMRLDRGRVTELELRDAVQFGADWMQRTGAYDPPPAPLDRYLLKGTSWNLAVSNWSPDFPTAAQEAQRFYALGGGSKVDGVIAINVRTLERLLELTGPVAVPEYGVVATADNVFALTEQYTRDPSEPQADRKAFTALLAHEVLNRALQPVPGTWSHLVSLIQELGDEKDLLIYSEDPYQQQLIRNLGWSGDVRYGGGDFIMLVDASLNGTKLNAVVDESIDIDVWLDDAGAAQTTVAVDYFNNLTPWASGKDVSLVAKLMLGGLYGDYVRLYVPPKSTIMDVRAQGRDIGLEQLDEELGLAVFGRFFALPRDERERLTFRYTTPPVLIAEGDDYVYRLTLRRQPGQRPQPVTLSVMPPPGMRVMSVTVNGSRSDQALPSLRFELSTDCVVEYRLKGSTPP